MYYSPIYYPFLQVKMGNRTEITNSDHFFHYFFESSNIYKCSLSFFLFSFGLSLSHSVIVEWLVTRACMGGAGYIMLTPLTF